jgi:CRP-like cAMP-binding protein
MVTGGLGKVYGDGEEIVRQGETGDCMYVIQTGQAEAIQGKEGKAVRLAVLGEGDIFGEMALFERMPRSATVRAMGDVRVLTIDKKTFLRRVHEDPSLAFRILQKMSWRIRELDNEMVRIKTGC